MKRSLFTGVIAFLIVPGLFAQDVTPPAEAVQAAHEHFIRFLTSAVTQDTKTLVGFGSDDDLTHALVGTPFRIYTLSADSIRNYAGTAPLRSIVTETDMWYFPIIIDSTIKMMMYVGKKDGKWMRAGLGSAGLARHMQEITTQWSPSKGYTPMVVQQYDIGFYLYSIPQVDAYNLTETGSVITKNGLGKSGAFLKTLNATILNLRGRIAH
jgi:hypothetical protein